MEEQTILHDLLVSDSYRGSLYMTRIHSTDVGTVDRLVASVISLCGTDDGYGQTPLQWKWLTSNESFLPTSSTSGRSHGKSHSRCFRCEESSGRVVVEGGARFCPSILNIQSEFHGILFDLDVAPCSSSLLPILHAPGVYGRYHKPRLASPSLNRLA